MTKRARTTTATETPASPGEPGVEPVEHVLRRHRARCLQVAFRVTRDAYHAQDAVQEAFLSFVLNPAGYDANRGPVGAWLAMLTHRRAVDLVRREQSRPRPVPAAPLAHPDTLSDPETRVAHAVQTEQVHHLLRTLDPTKRQILYMTYYLGYTQTQIAAATGMPLGSVKTRSRTALRQLRATLTAPGPDSAEPSHPLLLAG